MLQSVCAISPMADAYVVPGFCVGYIPVTTTSIQRPRSIQAVGPADFVVLERGTSSIKIIEDLDDDGIPETIRTLVALSGLNHGFALTSEYLYASTTNDVYRWSYNPTTKNLTSQTSTKVITNMNSDGKGNTDAGDHVTRTLVWDERNSALFVSVGAIGNVDVDSFRSRIRRFVLTSASQFPVDFTTGEVYADGLRNEVAMELSPKDNVLWGAGNSADELTRLDLGIDIYNDNPAEELHRFTASTSEIVPDYGYPNCWREYILPMDVSKGRGTAWAWPGKNASDEYCRTMYVQPVLAIQAHSAPLGLTFYNFTIDRPSKCNNILPFPESMDGYIFIAFQGSWNRQIPTGYKVVYIPISSDGANVIGGISSNPIDLLRHDGVDAQWPEGFRPVDVSFDECGRLLVSSDGISGGRNGIVVRIEYTGSENIITKVPTKVPTKAPMTSEPTTSPFKPRQSLFQKFFSFLARIIRFIFGSR